MDEKFSRIISFIKPYRGILLFVFLLLCFHFLWKIAIDGYMEGDYIYFFGRDITPSWFADSCRGMVKIVAWFIHLFPNTQDLLINSAGTGFKFSTEGNSWILIIWGCLGFKQMSIFAGIILFYWGPLLKKLWYIPMGCLVLTVYNVIRIATTVWLTDGAPERFESLHDGWLRIIYYIIVFSLWVVWDVFFVKNNYKYAIR